MLGGRESTSRASYHSMIVRKRKQCELWEAKGEMDFGRFSIAPTIRFDCSGCLTQFAMDNGTSKRSTYAQSACGQCKRCASRLPHSFEPNNEEAYVLHP